MGLAQQARMLERAAADMRWEWINKAAVAGLERSRAADARALERMEQSNV